LPYTEADLATVRAARLRGLRVVEFRSPNGAFRREEFHSPADYDTLEQRILDDIAAAAPNRRPKRVVMVGTTGW
jgi:hypothetical protein